MDTFLTIASKRDTRDYDGRALPAEAVERMLEAGRVAGSARNRQQRSFCVLESESARQRASEAVTRPSNLSGAALAVAITVKPSSWAMFDAARAAQNMMLAAASDGIGSCPNAIADRPALSALLGLEDDEEVAVVVSFGYPASARAADSRSAQAWLETADRLPLEQLVRRI